MAFIHPSKDEYSTIRKHNQERDSTAVDTKPRITIAFQEPNLLKTNSYLGPFFLFAVMCLYMQLVLQSWQLMSSADTTKFRLPLPDKHLVLLITTLYFEIETLKKEQSKSKTRDSSGSISAWNQNSHKNTFLESTDKSESKEFGQPSVNWFHTTNKSPGKFIGLGSHWDAQPFYICITSRLTNTEQSASRSTHLSCRYQ